MFEFQKLCKEYEGLSYDERRVILTELSSVILPATAAITGGTESFEILVLASCAADGKLSVEEYSLFKDATGLDISFDAAKEAISALKGKDLLEAADLVVDAFGALDESIKEAMVSFCLCLCSADGRISIHERAFIKKLIKE